MTRALAILVLLASVAHADPIPFDGTWESSDGKRVLKVSVSDAWATLNWVDAKGKDVLPQWHGVLEGADILAAESQTIGGSETWVYVYLAVVDGELQLQYAGALAIAADGRPAGATAVPDQHDGLKPSEIRTFHRFVKGEKPKGKPVASTALPSFSAEVDKLDQGRAELCACKDQTCANAAADKVERQVKAIDGVKAWANGSQDENAKQVKRYTTIQKQVGDCWTKGKWGPPEPSPVP